MHILSHVHLQKSEFGILKYQILNFKVTIEEFIFVNICKY